MKGMNECGLQTSTIFVGVDVHLHQWHVTIRSKEVIVQRATIAGSFVELQKVLVHWPAETVMVVYEAGFSGFWLYDLVRASGARCMVIPPSRIPVESGNRIKTDRIDSAKLAALAASDQLTGVWVPGTIQRQERETLRERRRIIRQMGQSQRQIKAQLHCYGLSLPSRAGRWSKVYEASLWQVRFSSEYMQLSFERLLHRYQFLRDQLAEQTALVRGLARSEGYRQKVLWLTSLPGIGVLTAMEVLTELGEIRRFSTAEQLAAYVGLTPSEYSSGAHVRRGHITRCGKSALRARLVESSWVAIRYDVELAAIYQRIRSRQGGKRAIIAVARRLLLRIRRVWLEERPYKLSTAA